MRVRWAIALGVLLVTCVCWAQEVAVRNLASSVSTFPMDRLHLALHDAFQSCERVTGTVKPGRASAELQSMRKFSNLAVEPLQARLERTGMLRVELRLRNQGTEMVRVPGLADASDLNLGGQNPINFNSGHFGMWLEPENGQRQTLPSTNSLFARSDLSSSWVELQPKQWMTVKLQVVNRCAYGEQKCEVIPETFRVRLFIRWIEAANEISLSDCSYTQKFVAEYELSAEPIWVTKPDQP